MIAGSNIQAGNSGVPAGLPLWVIVDAGQSPVFSGYGYRLMDPWDCDKLPQGALCQPFNEDDSIPHYLTPSTAVDFVKSKRSDLKIVYGGGRVDPATGWSSAPDQSVLAKCDFYGLHVALSYWKPAPASLYGKPVILTELEQDPNSLMWGKLVEFIRQCQCPTFYFTWQWRGGDGTIDLVQQPDVAQQIVALNSTPIKQETSQMALSLGQGFQDWINANQATPLSNEQYCTPDMSVAQVQVSENGNNVKKLLVYNKLTNTVDAISFD